MNGLVTIVRQAGAKLAGAGIIIEKRFQGGGDSLRAQGVRIESLAAIISMEPGKICFAE
jgi:xanthine phosphoribosyltransferase